MRKRFAFSQETILVIAVILAAFGAYAYVYHALWNKFVATQTFWRELNFFEERAAENLAPDFAVAEARFKQAAIRSRN